MSDSGGILGDCQHLRGGDRRECVECLREERDQLREQVRRYERLVCDIECFVVTSPISKGSPRVLIEKTGDEDWRIIDCCERVVAGEFPTLLAALAAVEEREKGVQGG